MYIGDSNPHPSVLAILVRPGDPELSDKLILGVITKIITVNALTIGTNNGPLPVIESFSRARGGDKRLWLYITLAVSLMGPLLYALSPLDVLFFVAVWTWVWKKCIYVALIGANSTEHEVFFHVAKIVHDRPLFNQFALRFAGILESLGLAVKGKPPKLAIRTTPLEPEGADGLRWPGTVG